MTSRICIKSHLLSFKYRVKINCDHRTRSILTDAIYRKHKECNGIKRIVQLHSQECNGTYSIALLVNGIFYSISRDNKQPIKRSEFNKVLYNMVWYGMVWYGMVWYGMVWYESMGMVFHDVVYVAMVCRSVNDLLAVTKESTFFFIYRIQPNLLCCLKVSEYMISIIY